MLVEGGEILSIYPAGRRGSASATRKLDARGCTLTMGLTDTHAHPFELGWLRRSVDLRGTSSISALRLRLSARVQRAAPGAWVVGMGWDDQAFSERRLPTAKDIDDVTADNPVILSRICGHIALLNSRAIDSLALGYATGVEYARGAGGRLTGVVKERAMEDAFSRVPGRSADACMADLLGVELEAARCGLTELHCIVSPDGFKDELTALAGLHERGALSLRYRVYIPPAAMKQMDEAPLRGKLAGKKVRIGGVKIFTDGSLGAETAALREPYSNDPANSGMLRYGDEELSTLIQGVDAAGHQAIVHAIGDRAIEQAIGALSTVTGAKNPRRHRIEHASLLPKDLRAKMIKHGIRVSVQPHFIISDAWASEKLGEERVRDLYCLRSMVDEGLDPSGGSDAPVETLNPLIGMWAAMVGADHSPDQRLTLQQSLDLYTTSAATNGFDEAEARLEPGGRADFTILDSDIEGMHPAMLRKVGVAATVVDGEVVYSHSGEESS